MVLCYAAALGLGLAQRNCGGAGDIGTGTVTAVGVDGRDSAGAIASASGAQSGQELLGSKLPFFCSWWEMGLSVHSVALAS